MAQFDHPSPTPYLPRIRAFEAHDLSFTPYTLCFMTTRVLEFGWTADYTAMIPIIKPFLKMFYNALGKGNVYESRFNEKNPKNKHTSLCFADSIAELLSEIYEKVEETKAKNASTASSSSVFRILDMCCGAGGPSFKAAEKLSDILSKTSTSKNNNSNKSTKVHLTISDLVPHPEHWKKHLNSLNQTTRSNEESLLKIDFEENPVDATKVEPGIAPNSIWTIYGAFHHFDDSTAMKFLKNATDHDECNGVLIVELAEHRLSSAILLAPAGWLLTILLPLYIFTNPIQDLQKIKNIIFFIKVLFFLPILMFTIAWDSTISCTRTLTTQEMLQLAKKADPEGKMEWHAAVRDFVPGLGFVAPGIVYLRGVKKNL